MINLNIFIAISCLLFTCAEPDMAAGTVEKKELKGNPVKMYVKSYGGEQINGEWGICSKSFGGEQVRHYDTAGNMIESVRYKYDDVISYRTVKSYDGDQVTGSVTYNKNGDVTSRKVYNYKPGEIMEIEDWNSSRMQGKMVYKKKGEITLWMKKYKKGKLIYHAINKYNGKVPDSTVRYDSLGNVIGRNVYEANEQLDPVRVISYDKNDKVVSDNKNSYKYDHHGNWVKQIASIDGDAIIWIRTIFYKEDLDRKWTTDDIQGTWMDMEKKVWVEFEEGNEFIWGDDNRMGACRDKVKDKGKFRIESADSIIHLSSTTDGSSRSYKYSHEGYKLKLSPLDGRASILLERIDW